MNNNRIRYLPKHRKILEEVDSMISFGWFIKVLSPLLPKKIRARLSMLDSNKLANIRNNMEELMCLPDRFNAQFAERGWIMFEDMNENVATKAVAMAEEGKIDEAEQVLVEFWAAEIIRFHITQLKSVEAFPARWQLAIDAEELYCQGKYHACTLIVLAVLDGIVQETSARFLGINQNFSAEKTILEAWDSIAGHSTGLSNLKKVILKPRKKTNTEVITLPYRHGIVHGMDVNFNTRLVAAKAWAALFSVGEWARLAQCGQLSKPVQEEPKSVLQEFYSFLGKIKQHMQLKAEMDSFKPRSLWQEGGIPAVGVPEDYEQGTPERALVEFLTSWKKKNYGKMAKFITQIGSQAKSPRELRDCFEGTQLHSFKVTNIEDQSIGRSVISLCLVVRNLKCEWTRSLDVVMIKKADSENREEKELCPWAFSNYYDFAREPG